MHAEKPVEDDDLKRTPTLTRASAVLKNLRIAPYIP